MASFVYREAPAASLQCVESLLGFGLMSTPFLQLLSHVVRGMGQ